MQKIGVLILVSFFLSYCDSSTGESVEGRWYSVEQQEAGAIIYAEHCAECHGEKAQGQPGDWRQRLADGSFPPPPLNGSAHTWHHALSLLVSTIDRGGAPVGGKMPAFESVLDSRQKQQVVAWIQGFWSEEIYQQWLKMGGLD